MNNVVNSSAAALKELLALKPETDGAATIEQFAAAFGQKTAERVAQLEQNEDLREQSRFAQLCGYVDIQAQQAGWKVSGEFVAAFCANILVMVVGVRLIAPSHGINTISQPQEQGAAAS